MRPGLQRTTTSDSAISEGFVSHRVEPGGGRRNDVVISRGWDPGSKRADTEPCGD